MTVTLFIVINFDSDLRQLTVFQSDQDAFLSFGRDSDGGISIFMRTVSLFANLLPLILIEYLKMKTS